MAERPRTTWQCRWVPNRTRKRVYTVADAARIACRVTRSGQGSFAQITARYRVVCQGDARRDKSQAEIALEAALANIEGNQGALDESYRLFQLINGLLNAIALIGLVLPTARAFRIASVAGRQSVQATMTTIQQQQAANQSTYRIVQQAAANEARFRLSGTR